MPPRHVRVWLLKSSPFERGLIKINFVYRLLEEFLSELCRKEDSRYRLRTERVQQEHALGLCRRGGDCSENEHR